ncbi:MAG: methyltransferase small [Chloroflexi bacterium]|nr:methyltransferase small [Chloroflexota bacterium]
MLVIDPSRIARVKGFLDELQYDVIHRALRPHYHVLPWPDFDDFAEAIECLPAPLRAAFDLLLLGKSFARKRAETLLDPLFIEDLLALNVLEEPTPAVIRTAGVSLLSFQGRYVFVSILPTYPTCRDTSIPVYLGPDSYTLAHNLPHGRPRDTVLDLGTGSGLQAILLAQASRKVVATDLHEDAVATARFNVALNGLQDTILVTAGDLYAPVEGERFDLIVSDAPYVPVPNSVPYPMYAAGGEDGMLVLGPLLDGVAAHLTPDGEAVLYAAGMGDQQRPFLTARLRALAERDNLTIDLVELFRIAIDNDLLNHTASLALAQPGETGTSPEWGALFERQGARVIYKVLIRIRHGAPLLRYIATGTGHLRATIEAADAE